MSIKIIVKKKEQQRVTEMGACLLEDGKTWVIPDELKDINPFAEWLPKREGHFVQRPYFVLRAKCRCSKCGNETPVVALGAKFFQGLIYEMVDKPVWSPDEGPVVYTEIEHLDKEIVESMQTNYPFFRQLYSKKYRRKLWGNCCVHCQGMQEEDGEYVYGMASPFSIWSEEEAREIRVVYFKLKFDYFIQSGYSMSELYDLVVR